MQSVKQNLKHGQTKNVDVHRGLLLVRYAGAEDEWRPPRVKISVNPKDAKHIELILNPDHREAYLWQPGSCLVARAAKPGQLVVDVIPFEENGSVAATVKVETLSQGDNNMQPHASSGLFDNGDISADQLSLSCHVAGIGDVHAGAAEWIAGPSAPARIEGLQLNWPGKPSGLDIKYCVRLARAHPISLKEVKLGGYAGTRGQANPITGIAIELSGPKAARYRVAVEATFLGGPVRRAIGQRVKLTGIAGSEPLVGLRLRIDQIVPSAASTPNEMSPAKVRVFRPRSDQDEFEAIADHRGSSPGISRDLITDPFG